MTSRLTFKQQAFINEYLIDFNAAAAAQRAGYKGNPAALANVGRQNLANPRIREVINQRLDQWAMPASEVFLRLSRLADASMADFFSTGPGGDIRLDLTQAYQRGAMDHLKYLALDQHFSPAGATRTVVRLSLYDSLLALSQLAKAHDLPGVNLSALTGKEQRLDYSAYFYNRDVLYPLIVSWLLRTYGNLLTGIIAVSKQHFGKEMDIPTEFYQHVLNCFQNKEGRYRFPFDPRIPEQLLDP